MVEARAPERVAHLPVRAFQRIVVVAASDPVSTALPERAGLVVLAQVNKYRRQLRLSVLAFHVDAMQRRQPNHFPVLGLRLFQSAEPACHIARPGQPLHHDELVLQLVRQRLVHWAFGVVERGVLLIERMLI